MSFNQPQGLENKKIEQTKTPENKIKEGIDFVFEQNPELAQIGIKEQYSEYLDSVFPESKLKDIVYHGSGAPIENELFKNGDRVDKNGQFIMKDFGVYFGNKYSHYGDREYKVLAVLNIKNPFIINTVSLDYDTYGKYPDNHNISLSHAPATNVKNFYKITNQDGIIQIGFHCGIKDYTHDDIQDIRNTFDKNIEEFARDVLKDAGINMDWSAFIDNMQKEDYQDYFHTKIVEHLNKKNEGYINIFQEIVVFEPTQIHILGSQKDIENFKEFISKNKEEENNKK